MLCGRLKNLELLKLRLLDLLLSHLSMSQCFEFVELIKRFPGLFGDVPSRSSWIVHDINVGEAHSSSEA